MTAIKTIVDDLPATISTMTILVKLDFEDDFRWNLEMILKEFSAELVQQFIQDVTGTRETIFTSAKKQFHNSIVFKTKGVPTSHGHVLNKQSVKIFCNGNMHITGVKDVRDALYLASIFTTMIELIYGGTGISGMFSVKSYDVQLINLYLTIPTHMDVVGGNKKVLNLHKVREVLQETTPYYACYNTERHPGVIIKAVDFTMMVFDSFNVLISSIKSVEQLEAARSFLKEHVFSLVNVDGCCTEVALNNSKKCKVDSSFDYSKYVVLK